MEKQLQGSRSLLRDMGTEKRDIFSPVWQCAALLVSLQGQALETVLLILSLLFNIYILWGPGEMDQWVKELTTKPEDLH